MEVRYTSSCSILCLAENSLTVSTHVAEFREFVFRADEALWDLFKSIDRNHNGEIDRLELKKAFSSAGITVSSSMLDEFLAQMDRNNDGVISYNEWRYVPSLEKSSNAGVIADRKTKHTETSYCSSPPKSPIYAPCCHTTKPREI